MLRSQVEPQVLPDKFNDELIDRCGGVADPSHAIDHLEFVHIDQAFRHTGLPCIKLAIGSRHEAQPDTPAGLAASTRRGQLRYSVKLLQIAVARRLSETDVALLVVFACGGE